MNNINFELVNDIKINLLENFINLIIYSYKKMSINAQDEILLEDQRRNLLIKEIRNHKKKFNFDHVISQLEPFDEETGMTLGRTDITVFIDSMTDEGITFECKRFLKNEICASHINAEYVQNGLNRFISGKYPIPYDCAGMISFVESGDSCKLFNRLNDKFNFNNLSMEYKFNFIAESEEIDNNENKFKVFHLILNFSNNEEINEEQGWLLEEIMITKTDFKYKFYYDESEHSRQIGYDTITADNFYDNFITVIVGWKSDKEDSICKKYKDFEMKYIERQQEGELKSHSFKSNYFINGFRSISKFNIGFINDFLDFLSEDIFIYVSTFSKIEFIINQLFKNYKSNLFVDINSMKYSIVKALVIYKPQNVIDSIYNKPDNIIGSLRKFFIERMKKNQVNLVLKERENESFRQILFLLDDIENINTLNWNYDPPFVGFKHFLEENSIDNYSLIIDREGDSQKTVMSAKNVGIKNVSDEDSKLCFGIRVADMFAGFISKLLKSINKSMHPIDTNNIKKTLLSSEWFNLTDSQLNLYKKLKYIVCDLNTSWNKTFAGIFADDFICLISLLKFMNRFNDSEEIKQNFNKQGEYFNYSACIALENDYKKKFKF